MPGANGHRGEAAAGQRQPVGGLLRGMPVEEVERRVGARRTALRKASSNRASVMAW